jgi:hypothetical protein
MFTVRDWRSQLQNQRNEIAFWKRKECSFKLKRWKDKASLKGKYLLPINDQRATNNKQRNKSGNTIP